MGADQQTSPCFNLFPCATAFLHALVAMYLACGMASAQQSCENGAHIEGTVTDPSGALIPSAIVAAGDAQSTATDASGHFDLPCVPASLRQIVVHANGFSPATIPVHAERGRVAQFNVKLAIAHVETEVQVNAEASGLDSSAGVESTSLASADLQRMADDPDDFLRQLRCWLRRRGAIPLQLPSSSTDFKILACFRPKARLSRFA
jgi:hypothetical protein